MLSNIPNNILDEIRDNIDMILTKKYKGATFYITKDTIQVFELYNYKNYVFKVGNMSKRFANIINGKRICNTKKFDLLLIPDITIATIKDANGKLYEILMEEKIDIEDKKQSKSTFENQPQYLNDTIEQLSKFICETHFSGVDFRNIPIIKENYVTNGLTKKRIALIDLEDMESSEIGLFGGPRVLGLLRCVDNIQHLNIIKNVAVEYGIDIDAYKYDFASKELDLI